MFTRLIYLFILSIACFPLAAQSLLDQLNNDNAKKADTVYAEATFKATRIVSGQSVENIGKGGFNLIISHRFGNINSGVHQLYGLDQNSIRIGFEYGLFDRLDIGLGRSRAEELLDTYLKFKLLKQSSGAVTMPVSVALYSSATITPMIFADPNISYTIMDRMSYINEILIARKFSNTLSVQLTPGFVHRNLTETKMDKNFIPYVGIGGRCKLSNHIALSAEYYWVQPNLTAIKVYNPLSIGIDIETGGHVFQLHFTNSKGMNEKLMIPDNYNNWLKGDFGFGFNIIRHFNFRHS